MSSRPLLAIALAFTTALFLPPLIDTPPAAAATVVTQGADAYRIKIGDIMVTALSDGTVPQDLLKILHGATPAHLKALVARNFETNPTEVSINAYLIALPGHLALVDTGAGELFGPGNGGKLLDSLAKAGVTPDAITDVLITHAHSDHAGGLVKGGARVFPNSVVHVGKADVDFFFDPANPAKSHYDQSYFDIAIKTLKPYMDAGKIAPIAKDGEILPGLTATRHPGHTPGSVFYTLTSKGESIVFVGDLVHSAAVQFPEPAVTIAYDEDEAQAAKVRTEAFARFAGGQTLIAVPHMPFPGIGHVRADGQGYDWVPVTYTNRQYTNRQSD